MASLVSVGTGTTSAIVFNSGVLTVNGVKISDCTDVKITQSFAEKNYRTLNSIKKRAIRRATLDQKVSCSIEGSHYSALIKAWYSASSTDSDGVLYNVKDGQADATTCYITFYENDDSSTPKAYQYQLVNAMLLTNDDDLSTENFRKVTIEIACTEIKLFVSTGVSN